MHGIDEIRLIVLRIMRQQLDSPNFNKPGFVFTNVLYNNPTDKAIYKSILDVAKGHNFVPIQLELSREENLKRIREPGRKPFYKTTDPCNLQLDLINEKNLIQLDISDLNPECAAKAIIALLSKQNPPK